MFVNTNCRGREWSVGRLSTSTLESLHPVLIMTSVQSNEQMTYTVCCPRLNEREVCYSQEHAIDVAYSVHNESDSYVWVEDYLGHTVIELGDIIDGITELVFA